MLPRPRPAEPSARPAEPLARLPDPRAAPPGNPSQAAQEAAPGHSGGTETGTGYPVAGHYSANGHEDLGYQPGLDYPAMPDYPAPGQQAPGDPGAYGDMPGYPPSPGYSSQPPYGDLPGYPPPHYGSVSPPDGPAVTQQAAISHDEYGPGSALGGFPQAPEELKPAHGGYPPGGPPALTTTAARGTGTAPAPRTRTNDGDARQAMLAYLTVPFFGFVVPFAIYVIALHRSRWLRAHASQALNVWITGLLYDLSAAIMGGMLALDSPAVALVTILPLVVLLWLVTLGYLIRAATVASLGREYTFPRWLCSTIVR